LFAQHRNQSHARTDNGISLRLTDIGWIAKREIFIQTLDGTRFPVNTRKMDIAVWIDTIGEWR